MPDLSAQPRLGLVQRIPVCISVVVISPPTALTAPFAAFAVGASVATDAVVEVSDALFFVLGTDVRWCVFVAAETRVARGLTEKVQAIAAALPPSDRDRVRAIVPGFAS